MDDDFDTAVRSELPPNRDFIVGALCATAAVSIWAGWLVMMRLGIMTRIAAPDLAALRFGVAGLMLSPVVARRGFALERLGWPGFAALAVGGGAPCVIIVGAGLGFAPVSQGGALTQGVVPLTVAVVAAVVLRERLTPMRILGFALIGCGVVVISGIGVSRFGDSQTLGHLLFLGAAVLAAFYTVAMRRARLDGLHAAAIAAVVSLIFYLPLYVAVFGDRLVDRPLTDIAIQALFQGVLTATVSIALYGRAVNLLGASSAGAFIALGPVMAALMAIVVVDEWPTPADWLAIAVITAGVILASGAWLSGEVRRSQVQI